MQRKGTLRKIPLGLALAAPILAIVVLMSTVGYANAGQSELAAQRQVSAQFHRVEAAIEAGYELDT